MLYVVPHLPTGKRKKAKQRADKEVNGDHAPAAAAARGTTAAATFKTDGAARRPKPRDLKSRFKVFWAAHGTSVAWCLIFVLAMVFLWAAWDEMIRTKTTPVAAARTEE
jgi:hypothetical protein